MTNEELKKIREEKNQSKGEFAKLLGVTSMVYGRYESGTLKIPENIETALKEMIAKASDKVVAEEIEAKKKTKAAGRKAKEAVEAVVTGDEAVAVKKTAILIQSQLGGTITPEEVLKRIPEDCHRVYIKPEENKAYLVKGDESGAVELW